MSYLYQLLSSVGTGVISFALSLFIARQVGADNFGIYSTAIAIGAILAVSIDGGMRNLITREHTRNSQHLNIFKSELPRIAMGHSLMIALVASIFCLFYFGRNLSLALSIIWCFWGIVISQYASALLRGDGNLKLDSLWQLKMRVLSAGLIGTIIAMGFHQPWQLLSTWAIASIFGNLFLKNGFRFKPLFKPLLSQNLKLYRALLPLLWIDLATTIYFRSDLVLLKHLEISDSQIGQYAAAYRLIEASILVATPISIIIFRRVRLLHEERTLQNRYIFKSLLIASLFGLLGALAMQMLAIPLVQLTYGDQYTQASTALSILSWMIALLIPNTVLTQAVLALNLEKSYALTATLAALGNIGLNLLFIPDYGTAAAAYSSIATELILFIGLLIAILQKMKER
jgi:O-antigen/teichoic acid export membrane protein